MLNSLYRAYRDRMAFYVVYIHEAHAADAWQLPVNLREQVVFDTPRNDQQRAGVAQACVRKLGIEMPAVVDTTENRVESAYTGWPDRIYIIDREGRVAFKTDPGPFGFDVKATEGFLQKLLPDSK